jgi:hypothetical protein
MSKTNQRESEPLYIVILYESQAEQQLKAWHQANPTVTAQVSGSRIKLYDSRALSVFQVTWSGNWKQITVWDTWQKRHIDIQ